MLPDQQQSSSIAQSHQETEISAVKTRRVSGITVRRAAVKITDENLYAGSHLRPPPPTHTHVYSHSHIRTYCARTHIYTGTCKTQMHTDVCAHACTHTRTHAHTHTRARMHSLSLSLSLSNNRHEQVTEQRGQTNGRQENTTCIATSSG